MSSSHHHLGTSDISAEADFFLSSISPEDMALLKDTTSRSGLETLLQSMPLDDLLSRTSDSDQIQIDRLFTSHMEQQLWKSYQHQANLQQQRRREQEQQPVEQDEKSSLLQEGVPKEVQVIPKKQVSTRGRSRTRRYPCTNGTHYFDQEEEDEELVEKEGANKNITLEEEPKTHTKSATETNNLQHNETKQEEERQQQPSFKNPFLEDEWRQQPAADTPMSTSTGHWDFGNNLSFVDGSRFSDCHSLDDGYYTQDISSQHRQVREQQQQQQQQHHQQDPEESSQTTQLKLKDVPILSEEVVQRIVLAMEARLAPRLDVIQNSLRSIQSTLSTMKISLPKAIRPHQQQLLSVNQHAKSSDENRNLLPQDELQPNNKDLGNVNTKVPPDSSRDLNLSSGNDGLRMEEEQFDDASEPGQIILRSYHAARAREHPNNDTSVTTKTTRKPWTGLKVKSIRHALNESGKDTKSKIISRARRIMSYNMDLSSTACTKARLEAAANKRKQSTPQFQSSETLKVDEPFKLPSISETRQNVPEVKNVPEASSVLENTIIPEVNATTSKDRSRRRATAATPSVEQSSLASSKQKIGTTRDHLGFAPSNSNDGYDSQICESSSALTSFTESTHQALHSCYEAVPVDQGTAKATRASPSQTAGSSSFTESATNTMHSCYEAIPMNNHGQASKSPQTTGQSRTSDFTSTRSSVTIGTYGDRARTTSEISEGRSPTPGPSFTESTETLEISSKGMEKKHNMSFSSFDVSFTASATSDKHDIPPRQSVASSQESHSSFEPSTKAPSDHNEYNSSPSQSLSEYFVQGSFASSTTNQAMAGAKEVGIIQEANLSLLPFSGPTNPHWRTLQYRPSDRIANDLEARDDSNWRQSVASQSSSIEYTPAGAISPASTGAGSNKRPESNNRLLSLQANISSGFEQFSLQTAKSGLSSHPSDEEDELSPDANLDSSKSLEDDCAGTVCGGSPGKITSKEAALAPDALSDDKAKHEITDAPMATGLLSKTKIKKEVAQEDVEIIQQRGAFLLNKSESCLTDEKSDHDSACLTDERTHHYVNSEAWSNSLVESVAPQRNLEKQIESVPMLQASSTLPENFDAPRLVRRTRSFPLLCPKIEGALPEYSKCLRGVQASGKISDVASEEIKRLPNSTDNNLAEEKGNLESPQPKNENNIIRPNEVVLVPHEMASPCTSLVSGLSYPESRAPSMHPDATRVVSPVASSSPSPPNTLWCSPASPVSWFDIGEDLAKRKQYDSNSKIQPKYNDDEIGAVVWASPNANGASVTKVFDGFPQNNPAFAIIAEKIAEAEAALKAELARGSIEKLKNKEIGLGADAEHNVRGGVLKHSVEPKNKGQTATILSDIDNHNIEIVHVSSASLFDHPVSPGSDGASLNSYNRDEDEEIKEATMPSAPASTPAKSPDNKRAASPENKHVASLEPAPKSPKTSFLERFKSRREEREKSLLSTEKSERREVSSVQNQGMQTNKGHENMDCTPSSSTDHSGAKSVTSVNLGLIEDIAADDNAEQDAEQIYQIVQRYYHYHQRYNAGNPKDFEMPLEQRLEQPLEELLTWTMVAFESIEEDFLTSFHDKATEDGDESQLETDVVDDEENEIGKEKETSNTSQNRTMNADRFGRTSVGMFDVESDSSDSTSTTSSADYGGESVYYGDEEFGDRSLSLNESNGSMMFYSYRCVKDSLSQD